jgi:hydroxylysine kinase
VAVPVLHGQARERRDTVSGTPVEAMDRLLHTNGLGGNVPRPTAESVEAAVRSGYPLSGPVTLTALSSEQSGVFALVDGERERIVKMRIGPQAASLTDLEASACSALAAHGLPVAGPAHTITGHTSHQPAPDCALWMGARLPGRPVAEVEHVAPADIGRTHRIVLEALRPFRSPALARAALVWRLDCLTALHGEVRRVPPHLRAVAETVFGLFLERVLPTLALLPRQALHGDFSTHNVLVDAADGRLTGVIDLGDVHDGAVVEDVAVAMADLLDDDDTDPWRRPLDYLAGFVAGTPTELPGSTVLPEAVIARLLQRALIAQWRGRNDPAQAGYTATHSARDWPGIVRNAAHLDRVRDAVVAATSTRTPS